MEYVLSYLVCGAVLAAADWKHNGTHPDYPLARLPVLIWFWPLAVFLAPASPGFEPIESAPKQARHDGLLGEFSEEQMLDLTEEERAAVLFTAQDDRQNIDFFYGLRRIEGVITEYWSRNIPPSCYHTVQTERQRLERLFQPEPSSDSREDAGVRFSIGVTDPTWFVGFSSDFIKAISSIDKTKKARVLQAIKRIAEDPMTSHGDTVKPLSGDQSGFWRYRIGEERLIYKPNPQKGHVVLIAFGSRGQVYR